MEAARATAQRFNLGLKGGHLGLGLRQPVANYRAVAPLRDEIDEVAEPATLIAQLSLLAPDRVGNIRKELGDLPFQALENVANRAGVSKMLLNGLDDDLLGYYPPEHDSVVAATISGSGTPVVAAVPAADEPDPAVATAAIHRAREQVVRKELDPTALAGREASVALATRPDAANLGAPSANPLPQLLRNDPQRLVVENLPFRLGLLVEATLAVPWVAAATRLVPDPVAGVLLPVENAGDGTGRPALAGAEPTGHGVGVENADDRRSWSTISIELKDTTHHLGLVRVNLHVEAFGSRPTSLVATHSANGHRTIAERAFPDEKTPAFLANLATQGLGSEVTKEQLVEDAAELNHEGGMRVSSVDAVGHRDHADALELKVEHQPKHQEIVASKTREVFDQNGLEETVTGGLTQPIEAPALPRGSRDRLVGVDVIFKNDPSALVRDPPAGPNLIFDALRTLVLGTETGVDGDRHDEPSSRADGPAGADPAPAA